MKDLTKVKSAKLYKENNKYYIDATYICEYDPIMNRTMIVRRKVKDE